MQGASSTAELLDACIILFGSGIHVSVAFINYLQPEGLRAAYRKKVLATHPDRALMTGKDAARMKADFIRATEAYRKLSSVVMKGISPPRGDAAAVPTETDAMDARDRAPGKNGTGSFFAGKVPTRKLLICQFLYYSGCISWKTYIDALVWQRRRRPPVGRIARDLGILGEKEIQTILKQRALKEKFGESAIRMGFLTPYQLMVLLGKQRRFHQQIGDYFVLSEILTRPQVEVMVRKQSDHNGSLLR